MSKIMISELQETTSAPDSSYIAIDNGTTTNKITVANYNSNANATAKRYAEVSQEYATEAQTAKDDAVSAKNEAETLANTASSYANASNASANAAAGSASEASGYVGAAQTSASNALASARAAEASAADIDNQVKLAKSWAVGNTGVRADEAVNNAMYWAGQAAAAAGGGVVSFNGRTGSVLPGSGDYSSDEIAHVNSDSTYSNVETEINNLQTDVEGLQTDVEGLQTDVEGLDVDKLDKYASDSSQWDTTPTANSTKPVTSGGIKTQFNAVTNEFSDVNNILGAKNMCPNTASTTTQSGVTYTVNSNGTVKITGTATANSTLQLGIVTLPKGVYKITTGQSQEQNAAQLLFVQRASDNVVIGRSSDDVGGALGQFTLTADTKVRFSLWCNSGRTGTVTLYPMCRPAYIRDTSYMPYAMTNKELTDLIAKKVTISWSNQWLYAVCPLGSGIAYLFPAPPFAKNISSVSIPSVQVFNGTSWVAVGLSSYSITSDGYIKLGFNGGREIVSESACLVRITGSIIVECG